MRTFSLRAKPTQPTTSAAPSRPARARVGQNPEAHVLLRSAGTAPLRSAFDFSRIAILPHPAGMLANTQTAGANRVLQRKCACGGGDAGPSGECEECARKENPRLQAKLQISEPGDFYEQEADRVADQVLRMPVADVPLTLAQPISHQCTTFEEK